MKKCYLGVAFAALLVSANANAELVLGVDAGYAKNSGNLKGVATDYGDSSASFSLFGQYFISPPSEASLGIHVGYIFERQGSVGLACGNNSSRRCSSFDPKNTIDILGVIRSAESDKGWSSLVMAGYSRREAEFAFEDNVVIGRNDVSGLDKSATYGGYKVAFGVQLRQKDKEGNKENSSWQILMEYADYGDETFTFGETKNKIDMSSLGLRIGFVF